MDPSSLVEAIILASKWEHSYRRESPMGLYLNLRLETVSKGNFIWVKDAHHLHLEFVKMVLQKFLPSHSRAIKVQNRTFNCLLGITTKHRLNLNP
jgi:hypothetical protein